MHAVDALTSRVSAAALTDPAPDAETLALILRAGLAAPDHGRLRPWHFIVIQGSKRAMFGELLARSLKARQASASDADMDRERAKAMRAPLIVVVAAKVKPEAKIPEIEQIVATAAAAENILVATHALGFGGNWKTGAPAYDQGIKAALGLAANDHIVGFLYLGTLARPLQTRPEIDLAAFVTEWAGNRESKT